MEEQTPVVVSEKEASKRASRRGDGGSTKHYWWRYLLFFLLGGVVALGGLAGGIYAAGTMISVKTVFNLIGVDSSKYLTEEYEGKSIMGLVQSMANGETSFNTIGDLENVSPYISELLDNLNASLNTSLGITINFDNLKTVPWADFANAFLEQAKTDITLSALIGADASSDKVIQYLCFEQNEDGSYNTDSPYSIGYIMSNVETMINNAKLGNLIDCGDSGILSKLADFKIGELADKVAELKINEIIDIADDPNDPDYNAALHYLGGYKASEIASAINDAKVGDLLDVGTDENALIYKLKDSKIKDLSDAVKDLKLNELITIATDPSDPDYNKALVFLGEKTIRNLPTAVNEMTLDDFMEIDPLTSPKILVALSGSTLTSLSDDIQDLTLGNMIENTANSPIIDALSNSTLSSLSEDIDKLTVSDCFTSEQLASSKILTSLAAKGTKVNDLGTAVNGLKLNEMMDIDPDTDSPILVALGESTINSLSVDLEGLTVSQCFRASEIEGSIFLKALPGDTKISEIGTAIGNLSFVDVFADVVYVDPNADPLVLTTTWAYLLDDPNSSTDTPSSYKMDSTSLSAMTDNMKANVQAATLRKLTTDGFLSIDQATLDKDVTVSLTPPTTKKIGEFTMSEFISYASGVI